MSKIKVKPTISKGAAKVPVIMQLEALECGAVSLAMIMAYYGKWVPPEQVRTDCGVSRDGSNAKNIYYAAQNYGFNVKGYRFSTEGIRSKGQFPCIIHWNFNHFVVLCGFKGKYAYINDPARGFVKVGPEEFDKSFTGVTVVPVPGPNFKPGGKRKSTIAFARKRLIGAGAAVAFVMLTTIISYKSRNVADIHGQTAVRYKPGLADTSDRCDDRACRAANHSLVGSDDILAENQRKDVRYWQYDIYVEGAANAYGIFLAANGGRYSAAPQNE